MSEGYNGWSNWDTWSVNLHLTNDETLYNQVKGENIENIKAVWYEGFGMDDIIDDDLINWDEIKEGLQI